MFNSWSQPITSNRWAVIATVAFFIARVTNHALCSTFKCMAWERTVRVKGRA
jgi:hypothetical protein